LGSCDPLQLGSDAHHHRGHPCTERSDQKTLKQKCGCELCRRVHLRLLPLLARHIPAAPGLYIHMGTVSIAASFNTLLLQAICWLGENLAASTLRLLSHKGRRIS